VTVCPGPRAREHFRDVVASEWGSFLIKDYEGIEVFYNTSLP